MASERLHGGPVNREDIAMSGVPFVLALGIVAVVQDLHLDAAEERHAGRSDGGAPNEHSGVPAPAEMSPLDFQDEVLVLTSGAHGPGGMSGAMDDPFVHAPRFRRAVRIDPPAQINAVEERHKSVVRPAQGTDDGQEKKD